ncbi:hypothetical protein [Rhizobium leguminosarum]|uniref:hypothetical protein n=1 Tax=Rhizobium leguminosarum TaxID=384 RepID=UPI001441186C|nr:hypothetical protein [Rhizobium leguminosarum]NKL65697.1 hypothetical protein [Rhizobium leguminosarum bv. viciae]
MKGLRTWRWGVTPTYNGFVFEERVRGWQLIHFLIDNGWAERGATCCISGQTTQLRLHSENYYAPEGYVLNHSIHMALHRRFNRPEIWQRIVGQYAVTGEKWFARLSLVPVDLAGQLRAEHGAQITDIFSRAPIPAGVAVPSHQIYRCLGHDQIHESEPTIHKTVEARGIITASP